MSLAQTGVLAMQNGWVVSARVRALVLFNGRAFALAKQVAAILPEIHEVHAFAKP